MLQTRLIDTMWTNKFSSWWIMLDKYVKRIPFIYSAFFHFIVFYYVNFFSDSMFFQIRKAFENNLHLRYITHPYKCVRVSVDKNTPLFLNILWAKSGIHSEMRNDVFMLWIQNGVRFIFTKTWFLLAIFLNKGYTVRQKS